MIEKRCVISLIRVSSPGQAKDDRTGISRQLDDIAIHTRTHGLEVLKEYRFEGLSGAHVQESKRFREMLAELSKPDIAGVVFATLDRFFRPEEVSSFAVFKPFEVTGTVLFCELGEINFKKPEDKLKLMLFGQMAGFERERMKDRMVRGKNKNRTRHDIKSDTLPVGVAYDKVTRKFSYTPESHRVKEAFRRVLKGDTLASVVTDLGFNSSTALRGTLKSYWWIGVKASVKVRVGKKWDEKRDKMGEGRKVERETPIMVDTELAATPLISREEFFSVQALLGRNRTSWTQRKTRVNGFLCSGLLYCECGKKMYHKADKRPGKPNYYLCSSHYNGQAHCRYSMIDATKADRGVWVRIRAYTKCPKYLAEQVANAMSERNTGDAERAVEDVERKLKTLEKEEKGLAEAIRYMGFNASLGEQMNDIAVQRAELKARFVVAKSQVVEHGSVNPEHVADQIHARFWGQENKTQSERKALLNEMVIHIRVVTEGDDIAFYPTFRIPDSILATPMDRGSCNKAALNTKAECRYRNRVARDGASVGRRNVKRPRHSPGRRSKIYDVLHL